MKLVLWEIILFNVGPVYVITVYKNLNVKQHCNFLRHPFTPNLQITFNPKLKEHWRWHFERISPPTMCHMLSHVRCHVYCVRCQASGVICNFFFDKVVEPDGGGSVINRAYRVLFFFVLYFLLTFEFQEYMIMFRSSKIKYKQQFPR